MFLCVLAVLGVLGSSIRRPEANLVGASADRNGKNDDVGGGETQSLSAVTTILGARFLV